MTSLRGLFNENCLDTMRRIISESIDLVVTSPPYDGLRVYNGYSFDFEKIARQLFRIIKHGGVVVWVVGDQTKNGNESLTSFRQAIYFQSIGFNVHDTMIYKKTNYVPLTHNRYEQCFEYMFVFSKGKPKTFNPKMIPCKYPGKIEKYGLERRRNHGDTHSMRLYDNTQFKATKSHKIHPNIFSYAVGKEKTGHPAPFPELLAEDQILTFSNEQDIVYEPFAGSGTVPKICIKTNRKWIASEISKEYCEIINKRIEF